jgi:tetratricopeptide (TPR) repeat protein
MKRTQLALLVGLMGWGLTTAAEAPYERLLKGDDARQAATLQKRIEELCRSGTFAEAVGPAEELLALRQRVQGADHWQTVNASQQVQFLRQALRLPAAKQATLVEAAEALAKALALHKEGKYREAEPLFRKALAVREEVLGPRHPETAVSCNYLAYNLLAQGLAREAEPLFRKALAVRAEVLGPRHAETAQSYNNMAANLQAQGLAREAEPMYRKSLAIYEEVLGPRHPDTGLGYNNVAYNLQGQGRYKEAEPLYRQALAVWVEVLGPRHADTAQGYNNLAHNLESQGRAREAEPLIRQALAVWVEVLGPHHPDTALGYNNLAGNLEAQGRDREAEVLYRKALAILEGVLGPGHPSTATAYNNLAYNLQAQGRVREAEPLFRRALAIWGEVLGPRHPTTAQSHSNLAYNLQAQGRVKEAELLYRQALAVYEEMLGPRHADTARSYDNLAANLNIQGRYKEAEPLLRQALAVREKVFGPRHADTGRSYNNLAANLDKLSHAREAEPLYRQALAAYEEVLGPRHPETAFLYNNLALNLDALGRFKDAEPLYRRALEVREAVLGPRHPHTADSYYYLAYHLQTQHRYREAEPLWGQACDALEAARLRLAATALDKAAAVRIHPHLGLAMCQARLGKPAEAWAAAEAGLARGLLDDLALRAASSADLEGTTRRLDALDRLLLPLLAAKQLDRAEQRRRDELLRERALLDDQVARQAAELSRQAVLDLRSIQGQLAAEDALLFWLDNQVLGEHWGCVLRRSGLPAWVRLPGTGDKEDWTDSDDRLPRRLRDELAHGEPDAMHTARRLAAQRLQPLASHLAAHADQPAARRLVVVPIGSMAGVPVETLSDRHLVSYAPSGTILARLRQKSRLLDRPTLLALGDPNFSLPGAAAQPTPPDHGLYLTLILPGSNAARAGLQAGDVLLDYGGTLLTKRADLKIAAEGDTIPITVWRDGQTSSRRVPPGPLGVVLSADSPAVALRNRQQLDLLADTRVRSGLAALPGTRLEVTALAVLLPSESRIVLLGSDASQQRLKELAADGRLGQFRLLHLATHATIDPSIAAWSALELARDRLPGPQEQARLAAKGDKVPTGQLSAEAIAQEWQLDADLVTLSACRTALGPDGGGEGLLGFTQVLLGRGARSLLLSLWKVDDTATALLMTRFYRNLLGQREGLTAGLSKAESLREAKAWLRGLSRAEVEKLAGDLAAGVVRAKQEPSGQKGPAARSAAARPTGEAPFAHPRYWAAFILLGDPN